MLDSRVELFYRELICRVIRVTFGVNVNFREIFLISLCHGGGFSWFCWGFTGWGEE